MRVIIPHATSGRTDILARRYGNRLSEAPGVPVQVEAVAAAAQGGLHTWHAAIFAAGCNAGRVRTMRRITLLMDPPHVRQSEARP